LPDNSLFADFRWDSLKIQLIETPTIVGEVDIFTHPAKIVIYRLKYIPPGDKSDFKKGYIE